MSIKTEFEQLLAESDRVRPGFSMSLGTCNGNEIDNAERLLGKKFPDFFCVIYSRVLGTKYNPEKQIFFDFIPGYRLIHISDLPSILNNLSVLIKGEDWFIPLFENYSNDYVLLKYNYSGKSLGVYKYNHDMDSPEIICGDDLTYIEMLNAFYANGVFFADPDGFLDYDFDLEGSIGLRFNPKIPYWS